MKRPFTDFLREQRGGQSEEELADALNALVQAVSDTGKPGSITYTIKVSPVSKDASGQFIVHDDIKLREPKKSRGASIFFGTPENNLVRNDPRQIPLKLREVDTGTPAARVIEGDVAHG